MVNRRFVTRMRVALVSALMLGAAFQVAGEAADSDWPQFRGVNRDGISPATGLLETWPEAGPKEVWRQTIGEGFSGMAVVGDRLYTMYAVEKDGKAVEVAAAYDATSGKEHWHHLIGDKLDTEFGNGPRATPTVDGDRVYVLGSRGHLVALGTADGAEHWRVDLTDAFGTPLPTWGFSSSALVDGDKLVVETGGAEGKGYAAFDKNDGSVIWTTGDASGTGYSSPLALTVNGERRYVYVSNQTLRCIDENGKEVWNHPWPRGETHAMPVHVPPNKIFASGAQGVGGALIQVDESVEPAVIEEKWQTDRFKNHFSSSVLHDGVLYGFDNATLKAIRVEDGEQAWVKRGLGKGSLIYADGHLLVLSDRGILKKVEATPDAYVEKGSVQALDGRSWTSPTLAGNRLYLRNHTEMVSYDLGG